MKPADDAKARKRTAELTDSFLLTAPAGRHIHSAAELCAPDSAQELVEPLLQKYQGEDRAAVISIWSQWYFALLLAPWARINMLFDWQLPVRPQAISFTLAETGVPEQFILENEGGPSPAGSGQVRFKELMELHLLPVCRTLSQIAGIKPGLFWNNAGIRLVHGFNMAREQGADITLATDFLAARTLPDGSVNRLYQPVRVITLPPEPPKIIRRLCCLRYKLSGLEYCPSCPLLEADKRKAERNQ